MMKAPNKVSGQWTAVRKGDPPDREAPLLLHRRSSREQG